MVNLVLASASPRRRALLTALGLPFSVQPADVDETSQPWEDALALARRLAEAKARAVVAPSGALVLGADTVVELDGRIFGKPEDADEAREMLRALRGRTHRVVTAVALVQGGSGRSVLESPETRITMRAYADAEIEASIAIRTPFDTAGGYAIQDPLLAPVAVCDGCYCNTVGLPLWSVHRMLLAWHPDSHARQPDRTYQRCARCPLSQDAPPR